jgi:hypothetical protein
MSVIKFGNSSDLSYNLWGFIPGQTPITNSTISFGNGARDVLTINGSHGNAITFGNGANDKVVAQGDSTDFSLDHTSIKFGNGDGDSVNFSNAHSSSIIMGNGNGDSVVGVGPLAIYDVSIALGDGNGDSVTLVSPHMQPSGATVTLGDGNGDWVDDHSGYDSITVGNGNDVVGVGYHDQVTVGTGQDSFVFAEERTGEIGAVTIAGFNPTKDGFVFASLLTNQITWHDDAHGNAVIMPDANPNDAVTLLGVHSADLHQSNFEIVDHPSVADALAHLHDMHLV